MTGVNPDEGAFTALADVLAFWDPVLDEQATDDDLAWGVVAPASSADLRLRVRNLSDDYTAAGVVLGFADDGSYTLGPAVQHGLSGDGQSFTAVLELGDLAPQATSGPVWVRRFTDPGADLGPAVFTLSATPSAWLPAADDTTGSAADDDVIDGLQPDLYAGDELDDQPGYDEVEDPQP